LFEGTYYIPHNLINTIQFNRVNGGLESMHNISITECTVTGR
jgi:hypothetical protein